MTKPALNEKLIEQINNINKAIAGLTTDEVLLLRWLVDHPKEGLEIIKEMNYRVKTKLGRTLYGKR